MTYACVYQWGRFMSYPMGATCRDRVVLVGVSSGRFTRESMQIVPDLIELINRCHYIFKRLALSGAP